MKGEEQDEQFDLENVLGESYEQLTQDEQKYWRMLAVFPASFKREAAAAVLELDEDAARDLLSKFNSMSLLDYDEKSERYSLHDLLVDFSLKQMKDSEEENIRFRHAECYLQVLQNANLLYLSGKGNVLQGLQLFDTEWQHINFGHTWAKDNARTIIDAFSLCNEYLSSGDVILGLRLYPKVYIQWLEIGLEASRKFQHVEDEGYHLNNLGHAYADIGKLRAAIEFYEKALVIFRKIGDRSGESHGLCNLGAAYYSLGDKDKAIQFYEQALGIAREIGDHRNEEDALGYLGTVHYSLSNLSKAKGFYEKQLLIAREIGDRRGESNALQGLGICCHIRRDIHKAIEFYEKQLSIVHEIGDRRGEGFALFNKGIALYSLRKKEKGIILIKNSLAIFSQSNHQMCKQYATSSKSGAGENNVVIKLKVQSSCCW